MILLSYLSSETQWRNQQGQAGRLPPPPTKMGKEKRKWGREEGKKGEREGRREEKGKRRHGNKKRSQIAPPPGHITGSLCHVNFPLAEILI